MKDSARYVKRVEWSDEDGCFVGSCPGVIGPCCHGDDEVAVYRELCGIVEEWLEDMDPIEADVDAARCAATRVANARERALALKDATMRIEAQDDWAQYKKSKRLVEEAERTMLEAKSAYGEANSRWRAVANATNANSKVDPLAALAGRTARLAYQQAAKDMETVSQLVYEATQNCKDARMHLR